MLLKVILYKLSMCEGSQTSLVWDAIHCSTSHENPFYDKGKKDMERRRKQKKGNCMFWKYRKEKSL